MKLPSSQVIFREVVITVISATVAWFVVKKLEARAKEKGGIR